MYNWITKQSNENRRGQVSVVKCARQVFLLEVGEAKMSLLNSGEASSAGCCFLLEEQFMWSSCEEVLVQCYRMSKASFLRKKLKAWLLCLVKHLYITSINNKGKREN